MERQSFGFIFMIGFTLAIFICWFFKPKYIVIERSSDSEWVRSETNYRDTVITEVKILEHEGKVDTVYPTIIYKRIEL